MASCPARLASVAPSPRWSSSAALTSCLHVSLTTLSQLKPIVHVCLHLSRSLGCRTGY